MTRRILPVRSIRSRMSPSSSELSENISISSDSVSGGVDLQVNGDGETTSGNDPASHNLLRPDEGCCSNPIPSIETTTSQAFTFTAGTSNSSVSAPRSWTSYEQMRFGGHHAHDTTSPSRTPDCIVYQSTRSTSSVSPPPSANSVTTSHTNTPDDRSASLTSGLHNLGISNREPSAEPVSSLSMGELGTAIDGIAADTCDCNLGPQPKETLGVAPPRHSRRVSSPRPEHKVEDEEPPSDEFHNPVFQRRLAATKKALGDLSEVLSSSSTHLEPGSKIKGLHERVKELSCFQPLSTRTIGFVGDSGAGKSSLINSLLDYPDLARESSSGFACTCVVTEYHYHDDDGYVIEIDKFSSEGVHKQLTELLRCYRSFHLREKTGDRKEEKELEEVKKKARLAKDTFRTMFPKSLQDEAWLLQESLDVILEHFKMWMTSASGLELPERDTGISINECFSKLTRLTSEVRDDQQPATWPYIRKIKVYIKAHILSKGLVLADLPGLRDLNSARCNITEQYILDCDEIFAVCEIDRAVTDVGVECILALAQEAPLKNVSIVCTKSDYFNPNQVKIDYGKATGEKVSSLIESLSDVENQMREIDEELKDINQMTNMDWETRNFERFKLHEERWNLERQRKIKDYEMTKFAIETRNMDVKQHLKEKYQNKIEGLAPRIFCVSNKMYWDNRRVEKSEGEPFLKLCGIVEARRYCMAVVAVSQLRTSTRYLTHQVPDLLRNMDLWVQSGAGSPSSEEKQAVRRVLGKVEGQLRKDLTDQMSSLNRVGPFVKDCFREHIWNGRQIARWTETSTRVSSEWSHWSHGSYFAFCRAWGNHTTEIIGHRNWNKEAMSAMLADLKGPWKHLQSEYHDRQLEINQLIRNSWDEAVHLLNSEWPSSNNSVHDIRQAMRSRKYLLLEGVEDLFDTCDRNLSMLETYALTSIRSSMFVEAMSKVYEKTLEHSGRGSHKRRTSIVSNALMDETIFMDLMKEFRIRLHLHADSVQQGLADMVSSHLDAVQATLDLVRQDNVAEESERDPNFRRRVADEVAKIERMMSG